MHLIPNVRLLKYFLAIFAVILMVILQPILIAGINSISDENRNY